MLVFHASRKSQVTLHSGVRAAGPGPLRPVHGKLACIQHFYPRLAYPYPATAGHRIAGGSGQGPRAL